MSNILSILSSRAGTSAADVAKNSQQYLQSAKAANARSLLGLITNTSNKTGQTTNSAPPSVDSVLKQQEYNQKYLNFINNGIQRLGYIAKGQIKPTQQWEEAGAGLQLSGQPFKLIVTDKGTLDVQAQGDEVQAGVSIQDARRLKQFNDGLQELISAQNLVNTRAKIRNSLATAVYKITELQSFIPPKTAFEFELQRTIQSGAPFKIEIDKKGNPIITNQFNQNFAELGYTNQKKLKATVDLYKQALNIEKGTLVLPTYARPLSFVAGTTGLPNGSFVNAQLPSGHDYSKLEISGFDAGDKITIDGVEFTPESFNDSAQAVAPFITRDAVALNGTASANSFTSVEISGLTARDILQLKSPNDANSFVSVAAVQETILSSSANPSLIAKTNANGDTVYKVSLTQAQFAQSPTLQAYGDAKDLKFSFQASDNSAPETYTQTIAKSGFFNEGNFGATNRLLINKSLITSNSEIKITHYDEASKNIRYSFVGETNQEGSAVETSARTSSSFLISVQAAGNALAEGANLGTSDINKKAQISLGNLEFKSDQKFVLFSSLGDSTGFRDKYGDYANDRYIHNNVVALSEAETKSGLKLNLNTERSFTVNYGGDDGVNAKVRAQNAVFNGANTAINYSFDAEQVQSGDVLAFNFNGRTITEKRLSTDTTESFSARFLKGLSDNGLTISNASATGFTINAGGDISSSFAEKSSSHLFTAGEITANDKSYFHVSLISQTVNQALNNILGFGTTSLQRAALGYYERKIPVFFDVNDYGYVTAKQLTYGNVQPKFLDIKKDITPKTNNQEYQKAIDFYAAGKPYFLDIQGGQIRVKELTAANLTAQKTINDALKVRQSSVVGLIS